VPFMRRIWPSVSFLSKQCVVHIAHVLQPAHNTSVHGIGPTQSLPGHQDRTTEHFNNLQAYVFDVMDSGIRRKIVHFQRLHRTVYCVSAVQGEIAQRRESPTGFVLREVAARRTRTST
jgi:hypothetical protein